MTAIAAIVDPIHGGHALAVVIIVVVVWTASILIRGLFKC